MLPNDEKASKDTQQVERKFTLAYLGDSSSLIHDILQ